MAKAAAKTEAVAATHGTASNNPIAVEKINKAGESAALRPIIFSTLVQDEYRSIVRNANGLYLDIFDAFLTPLEMELDVKSSAEPGRAHGMSDVEAYMKRIEATNFALANDDGGVSRQCRGHWGCLKQGWQ